MSHACCSSCGIFLDRKEFKQAVAMEAERKGDRLAANEYVSWLLTKIRNAWKCNHEAEIRHRISWLVGEESLEDYRKAIQKSRYPV